MDINLLFILNKVNKNIYKKKIVRGLIYKFDGVGWVHPLLSVFECKSKWTDLYKPERTQVRSK